MRDDAIVETETSNVNFATEGWVLKPNWTIIFVQQNCSFAPIIQISIEKDIKLHAIRLGCGARVQMNSCKGVFARQIMPIGDKV